MISSYVQVRDQSQHHVGVLLVVRRLDDVLDLCLDCRREVANVLLAFLL